MPMRAARMVRAGLISVLLAMVGATGAAGPAAASDLHDLLAAGWRSYQAGDMAGAETAFARAAAASPESATPAVWLGAVRVVRGDRPGAQRWFQTALLRHPTMAEAGYAQAWLARLGIETERPRWRVGTLEGLAQFVRASNPRLSWPQALWVANAIRTAARGEGIDERMLAAVLYIESRFEHQSISPAGAEGLGQLMPDTAAGLGVDPRDPWQNVLGAARLLRADYGELRSWPLTLAAYNAGSGAVRRWGGIPPYAETQWYVWAVLWVCDGLGV
ncbi:MAG TPA: lytic transglycosylase domain-containing protein [bacterium]|nr:lytic transglycosylase domain-containing protein [bacterium]